MDRIEAEKEGFDVDSQQDIETRNVWNCRVQESFLTISKLQCIYLT